MTIEDMNLIDIHAHLDHARFKKDIDKIIENARKANVKVIINSGVNPTTNRIALELSKEYDIVKVSFGLYPLDALVKELESGEAEGFPRDTEVFDLDKELAWIEENKSSCVAIGEIGLDYNWVTGKEHEQKEIFEKILKVAKKLDKPVIIHSRKAESDAIEILEKMNMKKVVMHCFSGRKSLIKRAADNGWFFSVPPVIKRLQHFQTLVEMVPIEQLLTETDAPYLSPVAGERNEPANVSITVKEIAKIKKISEKEVADIIWENSKKLFNF
ncbi:MAG: TatD family hydrolase [Nanoarchaeota archaeon]